MATKKKMLQAAAGSAGGASLDIDELFSTYLYEGNGSTQTITNGIDLAGEGGLVWAKSRGQAYNNHLLDTENGATYYLKSNSTDYIRTSSNTITSFNSDGFTIGGGSQMNDTNDPMASWTFRKAPKFFDVVTYTGNSTPRTISHNLGTTVGTILIKKTSAAADWIVYHRSTGATDYLELNNDSVVNTYNMWNNTAPTSTEFSLSGYQKVNETGHTYVAYLFAHNDGDGEFGPDGDADVIKCGSYTGNGTVGQEINLGFEPQFVMAKITSTTGHWYIQDAMRTMTGNGSPILRPSSSDAEYNSNGYSEGNIELTPTGFKLDTDDQGGGNGSGDTYIYMAIRRGPLAQPENATEVFAIDRNDGTAPSYESGFPVDMGLIKRVDATNSWLLADRLRGKSFLSTDSTNSETSNSTMVFDYMEGWNNFESSSAFYSWMWKRAPGYFDVVAYTGNGTAGRTVSHNLGVAPEMMWIKKRSGSYEWIVYSPAGDGYLRLNTDEVYATSNVLWNATSPTATEFTLGGFTHVNGSGEDYIAYLFASLPGISKVGSYTGNGSSQTIDCGFTSGARFVLLRKFSGSSEWYLFDTARGIVSGNDAVLELNTQSIEGNSNDWIDPNSSGFVVNGHINQSSENYIFYAIA